MVLTMLKPSQVKGPRQRPGEILATVYSRSTARSRRALGLGGGLSLMAEAAACSGGRPFEVPGRREASDWWVTSQLFAAARWRPSLEGARLQTWSSTGVEFQMVSPAAAVDYGPVQPLWSAAAASRLAS